MLAFCFIWSGQTILCSLPSSDTACVMLTRGPPHHLYPATSPQPDEDADALPLGHRQWLVKHTLLPEWHGQLIKQVLHAPTSEGAQVWPTVCTHAVYSTTSGSSVLGLNHDDTFCVMAVACGEPHCRLPTSAILRSYAVRMNADELTPLCEFPV